MAVPRVACLFVTRKTGSTDSNNENFLSLAEACYRFSPELAIREGEAVFLEVGRCQRLYSDEGLRLRLQALAQRFGYDARVGIAPNAGEALVRARYSTPHSSPDSSSDSSGAHLKLPLSALSDFADPFVFDIEIQKKVREWIRSLILLGLRDIGDFSRLPSSSLASRFGKEACEIHARVRGELRPAWPGFRPREKIIERLDVGDVQTQAPCALLEFLVFGLKGLIDRSMARLRGRCERASVVKVLLRFEKWSTLQSHKREWVIHLPLPQGSTQGLLPILQERLSFDLGNTPLPAPVEAIEFEILETVPGIGAQRDFFCKKEEEAEVWNALVGRLTYKLGKERVFVAHPVERHLPEKAWIKTLDPKIHGHVGIFLAQRPTRVFRKPEPLVVQGEVLAHAGGRRWQALQWQGPERVSGEWWRDPELRGFNRDYFQVLTAGGEKLWVFLNRKSEAPAFYLHGFFD